MLLRSLAAAAVACAFAGGAIGQTCNSIDYTGRVVTYCSDGTKLDSQNTGPGSWRTYVTPAPAVPVYPMPSPGDYSRLYSQPAPAAPMTLPGTSLPFADVLWPK